jgi:hypothetical protein
MWITFEKFNDIFPRVNPIELCLQLGRSDWLNEKDELIYIKHLIRR